MNNNTKYLDLIGMSKRPETSQNRRHFDEHLSAETCQTFQI